MTRVLMTADTVGGVWTYALELAEALAPSGVEVVLATMGRPLSGTQRRELRSSKVAEVHEGAYALEWMDDPWADVDRAGSWLLSLAAQVQPDLVHLNGYAHAGLPWGAPTVVVAHSCVVTWWRAVQGSDPPAGWDEYRRRVRDGLQAADLVIAPTAAMLDALHRAHGPADGVVVPNCRRSDRFPPGPKQPLVLAAGRVWDEAKNLAALDRIAPALAAPVVVAGAADHPGRPSPHGLDGARLLGPVSVGELSGWMARAAIFALPARYEPFGLAPLEAGLAGCALVLGDIPSLREVWADAAVFVDPTDDAGLSSAIAGLLAAPDRCAEVGARVRERALLFSPECTARGYLDAYELALGRPADDLVGSCT